MSKKSLSIVLISLPPVVLLLICGVFVFASVNYSDQEWMRAGQLSDVPDSGSPVSMTVFKKQSDAWTKYPDKPIKSIFARKDLVKQTIVALPGWHAGSLGISLKYDSNQSNFVSGCWSEKFDLEGRQITNSAQNQTPEYLPQLPVRVQNGQIWVKMSDALH